MTEMETGEPITEPVADPKPKSEASVVWPSSSEIYWYVVGALLSGVVAALLWPQQELFTDPVLGQIALLLLTIMFIVCSDFVVAAIAGHSVKTAQAQAETIARAINRR